jgi:hypothetical protein
MIVLQLMIAHLLGDFVFQSNDLIKRKYKTWHGTLEHAGIIALFTALLLFPFWGYQEAWTVVLAIFVIHFFQDVLKVEFDKHYNPKRKTFPFFVDQALHLSLIFFLGKDFSEAPAAIIPEWVNNIYFSPYVSILIVGFILLTFTFDITRYQFKRKKNKKLKYHPDYEGMSHRILAFSIFYLILVFLHQFYFLT